MVNPFLITISIMTNTNAMEVLSNLVFQEETATRLNALALTLLWEGSEAKAQQVMEFSASQLYAKLREHTGLPSRHITATLSPFELTDVLPNGMNVPSSGHNTFLYYRSVLSVDLEEAGDHEDTNSIEDNNFTNEAQEVIEPLTTRVTKTTWDFAGLYALQLYNMGVIQHESGLSRGDFVSIGRAKSFYRAALTTLHQQRTNRATPGLIILMLALYSNLGHTADILNDFVMAEACRKGLEGILGEAELSSSESPVDCGVPCLSKFFQHSLKRANSLRDQRHAPAA